MRTFLSHKMNKINYDKFTIVSILIYLNFVSYNIRGFEQAQENLFSSDSLIRILCLGTVAIMLLTSLIKTKNIRMPGKPISWLIIYLIIGILTLINGQWVLYSLVKLFEYSIYLMYAIYTYNLNIKKKDTIKRAFNYLVCFFKLMIIMVVIGLIISPSKALYTGLNDYSAVRDAVLPFILSGWILPLTSTSLCYFSAFLAYFSLLKLVINKVSIYNIIEFFIYFLIMILSQSRMAIFGFFITCSITFCLQIKKKIVLFIYMIIIIIIFTNADYIMEFLIRGQSKDMIMSVSGRTQWWGFAIDTFKSSSPAKQLFGGGFAAAEKIVAFQSSTSMYTLDSDFLSILIGTGVLGMITTFSSWIAQIKNIFLTKNTANKMVWYQVTGMLIMISIRMITATSISYVTYYLIIYLICSMVLVEMKKEKRD